MQQVISAKERVAVKIYQGEGRCELHRRSVYDEIWYPVDVKQWPLSPSTARAWSSDFAASVELKAFRHLTGEAQ